MKRITNRTISVLLAAVILIGVLTPVTTISAVERPDYSVTPDYAARYPHGVFEFYDAETTIAEGDTTTLRLIRKGGTEGETSVQLKAIDITAKYGVDYTIEVSDAELAPDEDYTGTLTENYLSDPDAGVVTSDEISTDQEYLDLIGYTDPEPLSDDETQELYAESVQLVADTLGISYEEAEKLVTAGDSAEDASSDTTAGATADEADSAAYASSLHQQKDEILGEKTPKNYMNATEIIDTASLLESNSSNMAASAIYKAAVGSSLTVTFGDGENEKLITVRTVDDSDYEPQEVFSLGLCDAAGGAELGAAFSLAFHIDNNDAKEQCKVSFDSDLITVGSNEQGAVLHILRTGCLTDYTVLRVHTVDGTAFRGADYLGFDKTVVLLPGEESRSVLVPLKTSLCTPEDSINFKVKMECENENVEMGMASSLIKIIPVDSGLAATGAASNLAAAGDYGSVIKIDAGKVTVKSDDSTSDDYYARFFANVQDNPELNLSYIGRMEVDLTVKKEAVSSGYHYLYLRNSAGAVEYSNYNNDLKYCFGERVSPFSTSASYSSLPDEANVTLSLDSPGNVIDLMCSSESDQYFDRSLDMFGSGYSYGESAKYEKYVGSKVAWSNVTVREIRLYPTLISVHSDDNTHTASVEGRYNIIGTSGEVSLKTYDAGTATIPSNIYRGWNGAAESFEPSEEANNRNAVIAGYDLLDTYMAQYPDNHTPFTWMIGRGGLTVNAINNGIAKDTPFNISASRIIRPIASGQAVQAISVGAYDSKKGALMICGEVYNDESLSGVDWREGDQLEIEVQPASGFECQKVLVYRVGGTVDEYTPDNLSILVTKGMKLVPVFVHYDITAVIHWEELGTGEHESKEQNLASYAVGADHAFTEGGSVCARIESTSGDEVTYTYQQVEDPSGAGTFTLTELVPGDVVTLFAASRTMRITLTADYLATLSEGNHTIKLVTRHSGADTLTETVGFTVLSADAAKFSQRAYRLYKDASGSSDAGKWQIGSGENMTFLSQAIYEQKDENSEDFTAEVYIDDIQIDAQSTYGDGGDSVTKANYKLALGGERTHTGLWLRELLEGDTMLENDTTFMLTVGDAYSFEVADHDMQIAYYFNPITENMVSTIVTGTVISPGGSVKHPNNVIITEDNYDEEGVSRPVVGAAVTVLSTDPGACQKVVDPDTGKSSTYYTSGNTDGNGQFMVYLPGGTAGLGFCLNINDSGRTYHKVSILQTTGNTLYILPAQDPDYQVTAMTLGSDLRTDEIKMLDTAVKFGINLTVAKGHSTQKVVLRSYDGDGMPVREWNAIKSTSPSWMYESLIIPTEYLKEGGRLTVEIYDENDYGRGEIDTGYSIQAVPKSSTFVLPQFDPQQAINLPVFGDVSASFDMGSDSNATPQEDVDTDPTNIDAGDLSKRYFTLQYGKSGALKKVLKNIHKTQPDFNTKDIEYRASTIRKQVDFNWSNSDNESFASAGGKTRENLGSYGMNCDYAVGVYMSMYTLNGFSDVYMEDLTLYARLSANANTTQQFYVCGIPVYLQLDLTLTASGLMYTAAKKAPEGSSGPLDVLVGKPGEGYFGKSFYDNLQVTGDFDFKLALTVGVGVGNPKVLSIGVSGLLEIEIEYQPWSEAAGAAGFTLDFNLNVIGVSISYDLYRTRWGMFKTSGYNGTLDLTNISNADEYPVLGSRRPSGQQLLSYDDGNAVTEVFGSVSARARGNSSVGDSGDLAPVGSTWIQTKLVAQHKTEGVTDDLSPILMPIRGGSAALYLRLEDDSSRGVNDFSGVVYSVIGFDGSESEPAFLENDGTFDRDLSAQLLGDGRVLVVWSDLDRSYGDDDVYLGDALNSSDLSYCIFDADGSPGPIRKLTSGGACESAPDIAYDEASGRIVVTYLSTDYRTDGVAFSASEPEMIGDFIYNSYSTVCFKVLDESGSILTDYAEAENSYKAYEDKHGSGSLNGMRYLRTETDSAVIQPTIDEFSTAAVDGVLYAFYTLDMDKDTLTGYDREMMVTTVDLATMEQSEPIRLTDDMAPDANPQAIAYDGELWFFWYRDGSAMYARSASSLGTALIDSARRVDTADGTPAGFAVSVQPSGDMYLMWNGMYTSEDTGERCSALYYKEYDPAYDSVTDEDGNSYAIGGWGKLQRIATSDSAYSVIGEYAFLDAGDQAMTAYKLQNNTKNGRISSYDAVYGIYDETNSIELSASFYPEYPVPGETAELTVVAENTGSLPSGKVTVKAELVDSEGAVTAIGTQTVEGHFRSSGCATVTFTDVSIPHELVNRKVRLTAYEDDHTAKPAVETCDIPYGYDVEVTDLELMRGDGGYLIVLSADNNGNVKFDGSIKLEYPGEGDVRVTNDVPFTATAKNIGRETLCFDVPDDRFDENGECIIYLTLLAKDGEEIFSAPIGLTRKKIAEADAADIYVNGSSDPGEITVGKDRTAVIDADVMPYNARSGYRFVYSIDDPDVASVDTTGRLTANHAGKAQLMIQAYKNTQTLIIRSDNRAVYDDGTKLKINSKGMVTNMRSAEQSEPALTKIVDITVLLETLLGDADGDGAITILDVTCIQRKLANLIGSGETYIEDAADADADGDVSILDATHIQRLLAGLVTDSNIGKAIG